MQRVRSPQGRRSLPTFLKPRRREAPTGAPPAPLFFRVTVSQNHICIPGNGMFSGYNINKYCRLSAIMLHGLQTVAFGVYLYMLYNHTILLG